MKSFVPLLLILALVLGFSCSQDAHASPAPGVYTFGTVSTSISATNAQIGSAVAADKQLVIRSLQIFSTQTGVLTFTDGSSGVAKLCVGVVADTPLTITADAIGPQGIPLTRGNELYCNALSSATLTASFSGTLE